MLLTIAQPKKLNLAKTDSVFNSFLAREKDFYRLVGVVLAWSLVHGGPAGNFFCPTLFNAIAYGPNVKLPRLEDVPDPELKELITQVRFTL